MSASSRDALLRKQFERDAASAKGFAARMRAQEKLFAHDWAADPWGDERLAQELDRAAEAGTVAALEDAGRALLFADRLEPLAMWLERLPADSRDAAEALAVVRAMIAVRSADNEAAAQLLDGVPLEEAVALHGLALLQLGQVPEAAARLEVLLAADALDEAGDLPPRLLPEPMPVLALFLTACTTVAERHLRKGERDEARKYALAARDALRRYATAEPPEGPSREEIAALLERVAP